MTGREKERERVRDRETERKTNGMGAEGELSDCAFVELCALQGALTYLSYPS